MNFEKLVVEALDSLPRDIREMMDNVAICVEEGVYEDNVLGLYEGVPKTEWGRGSGGELPDKITIFKKPILRVARNNREEVRDVVRDTVYHEIAHHFGFSERDVREWESLR